MFITNGKIAINTDQITCCKDVTDDLNFRYVGSFTVNKVVVKFASGERLIIIDCTIDEIIEGSTIMLTSMQKEIQFLD